MGAILGLSKVEGALKGYLRKSQSGVLEAIRIAQTVTADSARQTVPVRTGALQRSIQEGPIKLSGSRFTAWVFALQNYASLVEFGTGRMKARPYMEPAMEKGKKVLLYNLQKNLRP